MIVLGIDPGSKRIGYGILKEKDNKLQFIASGLLIKDSKDANVVDIKKQMIKILNKYKPDIVGVEKIFFFKNKKTAIEVAQARGVIIESILSKKIKLLEFSPLEIKRGIAGYGRAEKKSIAKIISLILKIKPAKIDDINDALAIAIYTTNVYKFNYKFNV
ncbi:MAG: crossover junction endodeoxyribonuclease RuvC [Minisyncoccia bacterium]